MKRCVNAQSGCAIGQKIAHQTDLRAFHANVEAALAGEYGRGFAAIASEMRQLAKQVQAGAEYIGLFSNDMVKSGGEVGLVLAKLVIDIRRTAELVEKVKATCHEKDIGGTQVDQAIQQLNKVTQQAAAISDRVLTRGIRLQISQNKSNCIDETQNNRALSVKVSASSLERQVSTVRHVPSSGPNRRPKNWRLRRDYR